jgi:hypothetical protein
MARTVIKSISRDDILRAIRTEPLAPGAWVQYPSLTVVGDCTVCAVGAV